MACVNKHGDPLKVGLYSILNKETDPGPGLAENLLQLYPEFAAFNDYIPATVTP